MSLYNQHELRLGVLLAVAAITVLLPSSNPRPSTAAQVSALQRPAASSTTVSSAHSAQLSTSPSQPPASAQAFDYIWPVDGRIVQGMWAGHPRGIDIAANVDQPVRAVRSGTVAFAGGDPCCEYGYFVVIAHDNGMSSLYGHLSSIPVKTGQQVQQGATIGRVGVTGKTTGPHLHFELRSAGRPVNPLQYLSPHRDAPPPPDPGSSQLVAAERSAPPTPAAPRPTPTRRAPYELLASDAVRLAAAWLKDQPTATYNIDSASCIAAARGPNYAVTCVGRVVGCATGLACRATLTACVYEQPRVVARSCP